MDSLLLAIKVIIIIVFVLDVMGYVADLIEFRNTHEGHVTLRWSSLLALTLFILDIIWMCNS